MALQVHIPQKVETFTTGGSSVYASYAELPPL